MKHYNNDMVRHETAFCIVSKMKAQIIRRQLRTCLISLSRDEMRGGIIVSQKAYTKVPTISKETKMLARTSRS